MKKCGKCNKIKSRVEFYTQKRSNKTNKGKNGKTYYGLRYICISCDKESSCERRKAGGWKYEKVRQGRGTRHAELSKANSQKHRDNMSDMYLRSLITKKSKGLESKDIPEYLVKMYRVSLGIKRELREIKSKTHNNKQKGE